MSAIFFDFDGALFDTRADLAATVNHTRREIGLSEWPLADIIACVGQGARHLLTHAIPETDRPYDELWPIFSSHYAEHSCETVTPYPGVPETLAELKRRGWRLGVNTNKPRFAVRLILEKFGLDALFGTAVVAGGDGIALKPDPASIRACAERLGHTLTHGDWMVGDSWTDLACAASAGVRAAYCSYGFGVRRDLPADVVLTRFDDLLRCTGAP